MTETYDQLSSDDFSFHLCSFAKKQKKDPLVSNMVYRQSTLNAPMYLARLTRASIIKIL